MICIDALLVLEVLLYLLVIADGVFAVIKQDPHLYLLLMANMIVVAVNLFYIESIRGVKNVKVRKYKQ